MLKIKKIFLVTFLFVLISGVANATELAVVNLEQIMSNAIVVKDIEKKLNDKKAQYQKIVTKRESELEDKNAELETKSSIMSKDALIEEMRKFQEEVMKFKTETRQKEEQLQNAYLKAMGQVNMEIKGIVEEMEQEEQYNYDIVLPSNQTLFSADSTDITAEVIKRLNKRMKSVSVDL